MNYKQDVAIAYCSCTPICELGQLTFLVDISGMDLESIRGPSKVRIRNIN